MRRSVVALLLGLLGACSGEAPPGAAEESAWEALTTTTFESDGETPWLALPESPAGVGLRVTTEGGVCFGLSAALDPDGQALARRFSGQACADCVLRSSVAFESGLFVFPAARHVRFAVMDCQTLNPLEQVAGNVRIDVLRTLSPPLEDTANVELPLRLIAAPDSPLASDAERARLLDAANQELAEANVTLRFTRVEALAAPASHLRFHVGDPSTLAELLEDHPAREHEVRVVVAGCLEYADPFFGPPSAVAGYTPRVLGGAGPADAVFLPDVDCTSSLPLDAAPEARGRTLAHELGHYLGLFHADPSSDGRGNLMQPNPSLASARGLTSEQVRVLRSHPIFRSGG